MTIKIFVKPLTINPISLSCIPSTTIREIKEEIHKKWKIHPKDQRLVHDGKGLLDSVILETIPKLNDFHNTIHLVIRLPGNQSKLVGPISSRLRSRKS